MMEPDELNESERSWRPKKWLMIKDGRKLKVSNKAIQIGLWILGFLALAIQASSLYKPQIKKSAETIFVPPELKLASSTTYIPKVMDREQELNNEKAKAREISLIKQGRRHQIERIQSVNLGTTSSIPAGSEALVALASGGTNGMVKAILTEGLKSEGEILLPARTVLLGSGSSSDDRLFMEFTKAILPDRTSMTIRALAYDKEDRILGVRGKKISDYAFKLAASSGLIFLSGMADGMREEVNLSPSERRRPSVRDAALTGVATATSEVGKDMLEKMKSYDNRVEVAYSTTVLVIFDEVSHK